MAPASIVALSAYRDLEEPHRHVHAAGKRVLALLESAQTQAALHAFTELEAASHDVLNRLDELAAHVAADEAATTRAA